MRFVDRALRIVLILLFIPAALVAQDAPAPLVAPEAAPAPAPEAPVAEEAAEAEEEGEGESPEEELVYLNVQDGDIRDIIKQISKATGRNFIIDDKLRGRKITILSERPMTKAIAYQAFISALNVAGYTIVEGPGGIYKVVNLNEAKKHPIPTYVDTIPISDSFVTRLVTLNNVGAAEMMGAIRDMLSKGGTISVYPQTNTLILTDAGTNIDRLMKIVKELDQEGPQQVMEIIPILHASAKDVAGMVNQLFEQQKKGRAKPKPGEPVDIAEVSKLIPDERTNAIVVLASKRAMEQVRKIIKRLDRKLVAGQEGRIHVYYLKYAQAKELATTLSTLTASAGKAPTPKGGAKGAAAAPVLAEFEGGIKITADEARNALIITATYKDYQTLIERVISKLDMRRRQVYLESVIMELRINKSSEYGMQAHGGFGGGTLGVAQSFNALQGLQGALFGGTGAAGGLLGGVLSQRTVDITTVGANGTSTTVSVPAFSAFLSALATTSDVNIVSTPNLLTLDNEEATIEVQEEEPIPGQQTVGTSGIATIVPVTYEKAGLVMKITPQIGLGDVVTLKIEQELSTFGGRVEGLNAPEKIKRKVSTNVLVQDGQTIVIGGLMQDEVENSKEKIPILGDIPLLGFFFSKTRKKIEKTNLLIFITPHIIRDSSDFAKIVKRKIEQRNQFIEQNYGKRQQKIIRDSIAGHRKDLLEFKDELVYGTPMTLEDESGKFKLPPKATKPQASTKPMAPRPLAAPPPPVITAPPVAPGATPQPSWIPGPSGASSTVPTTITSKPLATSKAQPIVEKELPPQPTTK